MNILIQFTMSERFARLSKWLARLSQYETQSLYEIVLKSQTQKLMLKKILEPFPGFTARFYGYYNSYCGTQFPF